MSYFIDDVNVIVDGCNQETITVGTLGTYNRNKIKDMVIRMVKEKYPGSILAPVVLNHRQVTYDEYQNIKGSNPQWFGNFE